MIYAFEREPLPTPGNRLKSIRSPAELCEEVLALLKELSSEENAG